MSEKYIEPVDVRAISSGHLRLVVEALLRYLHVEAIMDSTPEATVFLVRRISRRLGRTPKAKGGN
jgi:hypothetical protein